jgi:hypothetical protein
MTEWNVKNPEMRVAITTTADVMTEKMVDGTTNRKDLGTVSGMFN